MMDPSIVYILSSILLGAGAVGVVLLFCNFFIELGEAIHDETTCDTCKSLKRMGEEARHNKH